MKLTGIKPESENNVNVSAFNGIFGKIFSAERLWLKNFDFPFGVSIVIVAKKAKSIKKCLPQNMNADDADKKKILNRLIPISNKIDVLHRISILLVSVKQANSLFHRMNRLTACFTSFLIQFGIRPNDLYSL